MIIDPIGVILAKTTFFPGRKSLINFWSQSISGKSSRIAKLPNGCRLETDLNIPYERMIYLRKEEYPELLYLRSLLGKGDVFVDVGSNVGIWSLSASAVVGSRGHVFSFEPNPTTFKKLLRNLDRNHITNVTPIQAAVSSSGGKIYFIAIKNTTFHV